MDLDSAARWANGQAWKKVQESVAAEAEESRAREGGEALGQALAELLGDDVLGSPVQGSINEAADDAKTGQEGAEESDQQ